MPVLMKDGRVLSSRNYKNSEDRTQDKRKLDISDVNLEVDYKNLDLFESHLMHEVKSREDK